MSARFFYCDDSLPSSGSDSDYQEVQYSSSSVDRSSIGSIPWADDAIKQNQLDWERVERLFYGQEDISSAEPELRNEILEWHKKFPSVLKQRQRSGEFGKFSSLSFTSDYDQDYDEEEDDEDDDNEGSITPTNNGPSSPYRSTNHTKHSAKSLEPLPAKQIIAHEKLIKKLANDLRISSVPMTERRLKDTPQELKLSGRREPIRARGNPDVPLPKFSDNDSGSSSSNPELSLSKNGSSSATFSRMPPILKLTAPNQAQSAAVTTRRRRWLPHQIAANSQINKNAIILPAINLQRIHETVPLVGRSISAALNHRQVSWAYLPYTAAKFKVPK